MESINKSMKGIFYKVKFLLAGNKSSLDCCKCVFNFAD